MGAEQIAAIRPAILEVIQGDSDVCATFEDEGDCDKWMQFTKFTINAAYPHSTDPHEHLKNIPIIDGLKLTEWEALKYATFAFFPCDATSIARWMDAYFVNVLECTMDYDTNVTLGRL